MIKSNWMVDSESVADEKRSGSVVVVVFVDVVEKVEGSLRSGDFATRSGRSYDGELRRGLELTITKGPDCARIEKSLPDPVVVDSTPRTTRRSLRQEKVTSMMGSVTSE